MTESYVKLKLSDIGSGSEAGSIISEAQREITKVARMVRDEDRYTNKGKVTIEIEILRNGEDALLVDGRVKTAPPATIRKATVAFLDHEGHVVKQKAEQLMIPLPKRKIDDDQEQQEAAE